MGFENWDRSSVLESIKETIYELLHDRWYDPLFYDVKYGDESLVITVTNARDESLSEEFILEFN